MANKGESFSLIHTIQLIKKECPSVNLQDAFTRYSSAYPDFAEAVRFYHAVEEARVKSLQPGQEGQALVGFGDFKFETLQAVYGSEDPKKFVNYLWRKAPAPGTQMENAVRYVQNRDRQRARDAAAASTAAATTTTAAATSCSSSSTASVSAASQRVRSASQYVFYSSSFQPFSPAQPSKPCEEPLDEELVTTHPPPAPTSAGTRMEADDSVLGEPTDEELLEAILEQELLMMPPAASPQMSQASRVTSSPTITCRPATTCNCHPAATCSCYSGGRIMGGVARACLPPSPTTC
ncbi:uncharacterized protein LOC125889051 [Epinephelus fuscoguttatus]|uniref:uncharacterized protein LOC125889051 n=1 Tax=Epinephelus fuscoguttatus TaxID=293821 RepID=UPI0020D0E7BE|nr:uncharacterized protein LOC125889051 [Epinephelus fuscoguttatus]